jgi:hypothetical protein
MNEPEDYLNNILAAGGVYMALHKAGFNPEIVERDGQATNEIWIKPHYMKSRYRITVVMDEEPF